MLVKLTNNMREASDTYDVEQVIEEDTVKYHNPSWFKFYYGNGKYSREYRTNIYSYRIIEH